MPFITHGFIVGISVIPEMARHNQRSPVSPPAEMQIHNRLQRLLSERAHGLGEWIPSSLSPDTFCFFIPPSSLSFFIISRLPSSLPSSIVSCFLHHLYLPPSSLPTSMMSFFIHPLFLPLSPLLHHLPPSIIAPLPLPLPFLSCPLPLPLFITCSRSFLPPTIPVFLYSPSSPSPSSPSLPPSLPSPYSLVSLNTMEKSDNECKTLLPFKESMEVIVGRFFYHDISGYICRLVDD